MIIFRYILTGKLWVVMGAGWMAELLSTLTGEPQWLWQVVDLVNELQGVFIFLILVMKPKLYYLIRKRLGKNHRQTSHLVTFFVDSYFNGRFRISQVNKVCDEK